MHTRETRKPRLFRHARRRDAALASTRVTNTSPTADAIAFAQGGHRLHELLLASVLATLAFLLRHSRG